MHGSVLNAMPMYPILAPLSVIQNALVLALMWFVSSFGGVGILLSTSYVPLTLELGLGCHNRGYCYPE